MHHNKKTLIFTVLLLIAAILLPGTMSAKASEFTAVYLTVSSINRASHLFSTAAPVVETEEATEEVTEPDEQDIVPELPAVALEVTDARHRDEKEELLKALKEERQTLRLQAEYEREYEKYLKDRNLIAEVIYWENFWTGKTWEERLKAMLLTGSVVLNRVADPDYPDTIEGVLYEKGQYSTTGYFFTEELPEVVYDIADQLLHEGSIAPPNVVYQATFHQGSGDYDTVAGEWFCFK